MINVTLLPQFPGNFFNGSIGPEIVIGSQFDDLIVTNGTGPGGWFQNGEFVYDYVGSNAGNDTVVVNAPTWFEYTAVDTGDGDDKVVCIEGYDAVSTGRGNDVMHSFATNGSYNGQDGNDIINVCGGQYATETGGRGNDLLFFRDEAEATHGGTFVTMSGQTGLDTFQVRFNPYNGDGTQVTLTDFSKADHDRLFIATIDETGALTERDSEVKFRLDTNHDRKLDATDGYDVATDVGVRTDFGSTSISLGNGDYIFVPNVTQVDLVF